MSKIVNVKYLKGANKTYPQVEVDTMLADYDAWEAARKEYAAKIKQEGYSFWATNVVEKDGLLHWLLYEYKEGKWEFSLQPYGEVDEKPLQSSN